MNDENVNPESYILYMLFLFLINLPSVSNFKSPFENAWSKKLKNSHKDQPFSFFHIFLNAKFSNRFNYT